MAEDVKKITLTPTADQLKILQENDEDFDEP